MSSPRMRRLQADYEQVLNAFRDHPYITVEPQGRPPVERYVVTYRVPGLRWNPARRDVEVVQPHVVEVYLHRDYPRSKPLCTMRTPVFHPNILGEICTGHQWAPGETLVDVIVHVGNMLQYVSYNVRSPMNPARWAAANGHRLPLARLPLYPAEVEVQLEPQPDDVVVELH